MRIPVVLVPAVVGAGLGWPPGRGRGRSILTLTVPGNDGETATIGVLTIVVR